MKMDEYWRGWSYIYQKNLAKGMDHADAAYCADQYCERKQENRDRKRRQRPIGREADG